MQCNLTACADIFGVSLNTIRAWIRKGCPVVSQGKSGKPWVVETSEVRLWREDIVAMDAMGDVESLNFDEAKRQKMAAEAAIAQIQLKQMRRELVLIEDVVDVLGNTAARIRSRLLALKTRLGAQLGLDENQKLGLERGIDECLAELSEGVGAFVDEGAAGESAAAA